MGGLDGQLNLDRLAGFDHLGARECIAPKCGEREKIMPDGSCYPCEDFTVVSEDGRQCQMPECSFNEFVEMDGFCA
jgi:hypothetical protein